MLSHNRRRFATFRSRSLRPAPALCYIIPIFIPRCAGTSRHGRLVRKHVPDYDPGCARQSTSMPALHRRILPNCRPMVDGEMRKCSAGACPPLGSGWGVAESAVPIRCTKPQLPLFIPSCAGCSRHEQLVPKWIPGPAGDTNHRRPNNDSRGSPENVALGRVPSQGHGGQPAPRCTDRVVVSLIHSSLPSLKFAHPSASLPPNEAFSRHNIR